MKKDLMHLQEIYLFGKVAGEEESDASVMQKLARIATDLKEVFSGLSTLKGMK